MLVPLTVAMMTMFRPHVAAMMMAMALPDPFAANKDLNGRMSFGRSNGGHRRARVTPRATATAAAIVLIFIMFS
jgi:hypothetical protein